MATTAFPFTSERLRALQPKDKRYEVRDTTTAGLVCRVAPSGVKTLCFYRWVPSVGRPERITIGRWPAASVDAARKRCAMLSAEVAQGHSPAVQLRELRAESTLSDLWDLYNEAKSTKWGEKTAADHKSLWETYLLRPLGQRRLSTVTLEEVGTLHRRIGAKHPRTANKVAGLLRSMYRWAARERKYTGPVPTGVEMYKIASRERFVQQEEMPRFIAAVQASPEPYNRLWHLLLLTGVRLNNMLAARWEQFDLGAGLWQVPSSAHKNKQPHALPLLPAAVELLRAQRATVPEKSPWVWPAAGTKTGHLTQNNIRNAWDDLCTRANVQGLVRHDLRRTVGSYLAMSGASLSMVGAALGHRSIQASQVYARLSLPPVRAALETAMQPVSAPAAPAKKRRTARP